MSKVAASIVGELFISMLLQLMEGVVDGGNAILREAILEGVIGVGMVDRAAL